MRAFKKTKRFELYIEIERSRILDRFFSYRCEDGNHELWLGRCYITLFIAQT